MDITSLNGEWKLTGPKIDCSITLPGDVHSALIKKNLIPDPYYGKNESELLWIGKSQWIFEREFDYKIKKGTKSILAAFREYRLLLPGLLIWCAVNISFSLSKEIVLLTSTIAAFISCSL